MIVAVLPAAAQKRNINLTIAVTGPKGGAITDADLTLIQTDYSLTYSGVALNSEGKCTVKVYAGNHSLEVVKSGYTSQTTSFAVSADTTVTVQLGEKTQKPYALAVDVTHNAQTGFNDANFTWNTEAPVLWDDFESYGAFAVNFGDWTGIDGDGLNAATLTGTYLNQGVMEYAQIINPLKVNPAWWYDYPVLRPYAGQQYVGFIRTATGAANDDWLISPTFTPGTSNVLSFMAKAADVYKEKFQVYVTTVVDNPKKSDFVMISPGNYETVDYKKWYNKVYSLASYAGKPVKIAIRYMSEANNGGAFMLMVDNVFVGQSFANPNATQAPVMPKARRVTAKSAENPNETFRVYLNDQFIGTTSAYEYGFPGLAEGTYKFGVQAVYDFSETEIVDTTITIVNDVARVQLNVATNNGLGVDSTMVEFMDVNTSERYEAMIEDGKAVFPSLPKGKYYVGIAADNFQVYDEEITIDSDVTLNIVLQEKIVKPYNVTADVKPTGINSNEVTVKWNQNISYKDSFEDYDDFATGTFGDWTTYDIDQHNCYPIGLGSSTNIVTFPGASTPSVPCAVPPMVFNPWNTVPAMLPTDIAVQAPSGDKTVIFFSPQNNGANKWLISPEITVRDNFVCRFTAKAYAEYTESMEVCAFLDGASNPKTDSYEKVSDIASVTCGYWTIYETDLSRYVGQKIRIGVHYTSFDAFFAQIDDFYVGNLADDGSTVDVGLVKDYTITLDGDSVATVTEPQVVLSGVKAGKHTVGIQARYTSGASEFTYYDFTVALTGDVNGDGKVDTSDITALINKILGSATFTDAACDINGDGVVNTSDVTALISIILG